MSLYVFIEIQNDKDGNSMQCSTQILDPTFRTNFDIIQLCGQFMFLFQIFY